MANSLESYEKARDLYSDDVTNRSIEKSITSMSFETPCV